MKKWVEDNKILECLVGSHAYGFATPESDEDIRGITISPLRYAIGFHSNFEQQEYSGEDKVIYSLAKFMQLAAQCNPNILDLIFIPKRCIRHLDKYGEMLIENRDMFISKKARHTFSGYAFEQLNRIKRHKKWIDNPPDKPDPMNYTFTRYMVLYERDGNNMPTKVSKEIYDTFPGSSKWIETGVDSAYEADLKHYNHYVEWKKKRNPERAALEEKFKYDTKHSVHLIRLLRMGIEILRDGKVIVDREEAGDAEELRQIRNGSMSYEELIEYAEKQDGLLNELYTSSSLRHSVDIKAIENLYIDMICKKFGVTWSPEVNAFED